MSRVVENVEAQFLFLPSSQKGRWATVPQVEQIAQGFFFPGARGKLPFSRRRSEGGQNIMIVEAPDMPGLNIPHFVEELNRTGKFFEGYIQHTATGFFRLARLAPSMLRNMRTKAEQVAETPPSTEDDAKDMFFLRSLLAFDRLHQVTPFEIFIEPRSGEQEIKEVRDYRRGIRNPLKNLAEQIEEVEGTADLDELVAKLAPVYDAKLSIGALIARNRLKTYDRFVIDTFQAISPKDPVRVLIPRDNSDTYTSQPLLEAALKGIGIKFREPISLETEAPSWVDRLSYQFINDPNRILTRSEALVYMIAVGMLESYSGLGSIIGTEEAVIETWASIPPDELESFFRKLLKLDPTAQNRELLNFYGTLRGFGYRQIGLGDVFTGGLNRILENSTDPVLDDVRRLMRHEPYEPEE